MQNIFKIVTMFAVIGIVLVAVLFVLDLATSTEVKDALQKVLLVLGIVALGGMSISFLAKPRA